MTAMHQTTIIFLALLLCTHVRSQDSDIEFDVAKPSTNRLFIEDFAYPFFFDGEVHSNFVTSYVFDPEFLIQLQGFYDTYRLNDVFELRLRGKRYLLDNMYLFVGSGLEMEKDKHGLEPPPIRLKVINGFGYDFDDKFSMEASHNIHFNKTSFGNYGTPNLFSLSGKYKF